MTPSMADEPATESAPRKPSTELEGRWLSALVRWLDGLQPELPLPARIDQLSSGMDWLREGLPPSMLSSLRRTSPTWALTRRLRLLLTTLDERPLLRPRFQRLVRSVLADVGGTSLFETGLPNDRGLLEETTDRLARGLLPTPRDARDLGELVFCLFPSPREAEWLRELPADLIARFVDLIEDGAEKPPFSRAAEMLRDAFALTAVRAAGLGLTREIRDRSEPTAVRESPFFQLARASHALLDGAPWPEEVRLEVKQRIAECRRTVPVVLRHLEEFGVSVDVVYRVEVITQSLDRLGQLLHLVTLSDENARREAQARLLADLVDARVRNRSVPDLVRTNLRLLARKIIERSGETGEHYITATRREYGRMLVSAGGGGLLTSVTCMLKYLVLWGHLPLFVEGTLASCNYASGFLAMQLLGFTLATKQPSMTAAALAGALGGASKEQDLDDMVTLITRITRSQLAAAVGNITMVIPAALALNAIYRGVTGHPYLDAATAEHTLLSSHPLRSGSIYFATLTGIFLWMSSVCAGWLENWAIFRRLPEALGDAPLLRRLVGARRATAFGAWLPRNLSGIGGNVSLGFLLGMMPVFGKFLGVPIEVRHVTFATGSLTLAVASLGSDALTTLPFAGAALGIAVIALLNFSVSFTLALAVALRAREVDRPWLLRLGGALLTRFIQRPLDFVFPPKAMAETVSLQPATK